MKFCIILAILALAIGSQAQVEIKTVGLGELAHAPYHATLSQYHPYDIRPVGQGIIVSTRFVLTVAGTMYRVGPVYVGVGSDRHDQLLYYYSSRFHIHPSWSLAMRTHDIAMYELENPLTFNSFVQPIALPPFDYTISPLINEQGQITTFSGNFLMNSYQRVTPPESCYAVETSFCADYEDFGLERFSPINATSGAGFVTKVFGVDTLVGVLTSNSGSYQSYVKVWVGRDWIFGLTGA